MMKGAFSHGESRQGEQAAQTRSTLSVPWRLCRECIVVRRFVSETIQRWVFWLCVVSCLVVREEKGKLIILGMIEVTCQRKIKGPQGRQLVQERTWRRCRRKEGARKLALSDTLSAGRDRDGGEHAERERSRGRRRSRTRCSKQRCQWGWQRPW